MPSALSALQIPDGFSVVHTGACRVVLPERNRGVLSELEETCQEGVTRIFAQLGQKQGAGKTPLEVRIVSSPNQMKAVAPKKSPPPPWSGAVAYPEHMMVIVPLRNRTGSPLADLDIVLEHELSHLALRSALGGAKVPRWFSEGIAIHQSEKSSIKRHWLVWLASRRDRLLPLDEIEVYPDRVVDINLAYAEAADFFGLLLREGGWLSVRALIRRVADGAEFDEAVRYAFGRSLASLEREWLSGLTSRWQWIPLITGTGALWGFIVALFLLAYVLVKRRKKRRLQEMALEEEALDQVIETLDDLKEHALPATVKAKSTAPVPTKIRVDDEIHTLH
jgi:hypothetical protein